MLRLPRPPLLLGLCLCFLATAEALCQLESERAELMQLAVQQREVETQLELLKRGLPADFGTAVERSALVRLADRAPLGAFTVRALAGRESLKLDHGWITPVVIHRLELAGHGQPADVLHFFNMAAPLPRLIVLERLNLEPDAAARTSSSVRLLLPVWAAETEAAEAPDAGQLLARALRGPAARASLEPALAKAGFAVSAVTWAPRGTCEAFTVSARVKAEVEPVDTPGSGALYDPGIAAACTPRTRPSAGRIVAQGARPASAETFTLRLREADLVDVFAALNGLTGRGFVVDADVWAHAAERTGRHSDSGCAQRAERLVQAHLLQLDTHLCRARSGFWPPPLRAGASTAHELASS